MDKSHFNLLFLFLIFFFIGNCFSQKDSIRYFDEHYRPISKEAFEQKRFFDGTFLDTKGDSANHRILAYRKIEGTIANKSNLDSLLIAVTNIQIDPKKPLVVIYYPGKDLCNSTGTLSRKKFRDRYNRLEKNIDKLQNSNVFYVFKDNEGLYDRYDGFKTWISDPQGIFERLFFPRHFPCSSNVVISPSGKFISSRGESDLTEIVQAVKELKE